MKPATLLVGLVLTTAQVARAEGPTEAQASVQSQAPRAPGAAPATPKENAQPSNTAVYVLAGVSLVGLTVGTITGVTALEQKGHAEDNCSPSQRLCNAAGVEANDEGRTLAMISAATLAVGATTLLTAIILYRSPTDTTQVAATVTPEGGRVMLRTAW